MTPVCFLFLLLCPLSELQLQECVRDDADADVDGLDVLLNLCD